MINIVRAIADIVTSPLFIMLVPLGIGLFSYILTKKKSFVPTVLSLLSTGVLVHLWMIYRRPLNCPLWHVCEPYSAMVSDEYAKLWLPFIAICFIAAAAVLILGITFLYMFYLAFLRKE